MVGCSGNAPAGRDARRIYSPPRLFNGLTAQNLNPCCERELAADPHAYEVARRLTSRGFAARTGHLVVDR